MREYSIYMTFECTSKINHGHTQDVKHAYSIPTIKEAKKIGNEWLNDFIVDKEKCLTKLPIEFKDEPKWFYGPYVVIYEGRADGEIRKWFAEIVNDEIEWNNK